MQALERADIESVFFVETVKRIFSKHVRIE
jgi:hypothetical protein